MDLDNSHRSLAEETVHQVREPTRRRSWLRYVGIAAIVLVVGAICVGGVMIYLGISTSLRGEENLHATSFTIGLVDRFVAENGRWPRSWTELERLRIPASLPFPLHAYDWPTSSGHLQEHVTIDFEADPGAIVSQDPMQFAAIKPIGPFYEYRDEGGVVTSLQTTLRKVLEKQTGTGTK